MSVADRLVFICGFFQRPICSYYCLAMNTPHTWLIPVPKLLWSEYSEEPFLRCVDCNCELEACDFYLVQKCYVGTEPVFEVAICDKCRTNLSVQCSEETNRAVQAFLQAHLSRREEEFKVLDEMQTVLQKCMDECAICSRPRSECHRYTVGGLGHQMDLVVQLSPQAQSPLMICQKCEGTLGELVSQQTRDTWDRFVEEHFDSPPGVEVDSPMFL